MTDSIIGDQKTDKKSQLPAPSTIAMVEKETTLITSSNVEQKIKEMEAIAGFQDRARRVALTITTSNDWSLMNNTPHLEESGVKKVLMLIGAQTHDFSMETVPITDEKGRLDYIYRTTGKITAFGRTLTEVGICSTRDDFFAKRNNELLPLSEIKIPDVQKKSITNCEFRLLMAVFPLKPTRAELESSGIKLEKNKNVSYGKGTQGGTTDTQEEKNRKADLTSKILRLTGGDIDAAKSKLKELTTWTNKEGRLVEGKTETVQLSPKQVKFILDKVNQLILEMEKSGDLFPEVKGGGND